MREGRACDALGGLPLAREALHVRSILRPPPTLTNSLRKLNLHFFPFLPREQTEFFHGVPAEELHSFYQDGQ